MRKIISFLSLVLILTACVDENMTTDFSSNSFSFIETQSFDDYFGESRLSIYDLSSNQIINTEIETGYYGKWVDSKLLYTDGHSIIRYDPKTRESTTLLQLNNEIQSFDYHNQKIVYSDYSDIFVFDETTGATTKITENIEGDFGFPTVSPNGNSILFNNWIRKVREGDTAPTLTTQFMIYHFDSDSFQEVEMFDEFASPDPHPNWSPNGEDILYEQYQGVFIFNINAEQLTRITEEDVIATNPSYSQDGKMISYLSSDNSDGGNDSQNFLTIYDLEIQTSQVVNSTSSYDAIWNSQSDKIIFCTEKGIHQYDMKSSEITDLVEAKSSIFLHSIQWIE